ncbi:MAG TPA: cupin domain-containing protein [Methylomirabilota bacterium]|jgi:gentisate 1,2-dioxygenase|nr:cupin domain-containing protein [Methylomirabilota bacterium]
MSVPVTDIQSAREQYTASLRAAGLDAPWMEPGPLIKPKASAMRARAWRWRDIEPLIHRSPEFMAPGRGAERRILRLDNPGVPERTSGHTISVAVQYLLPGEIAPAHRHTPNAIRFMLHGEGAYTTIEGDKFVMRRGDLVVTPSMTWHDHGNEGAGPVIWTDALDSPVVRYLENLAMDPYEGEAQPVRAGAPARHLHYRWEAAHGELQRRQPDPFDDILVEYRDPATGGSVVPALGCYLQMLRPGVRTRAHRETSSAVYHVVSGAGLTEIDGDRVEWGEGDFFAIPPRARHAHANPGTAPAILYSVQDVPLLRALGFYRVES